MQGEGGFVRDFRSTIDWEWFTDVNTAHLWEYIRLRVNYEPSRFRGIEIRRGEMLESIATISAKTGLSIQNVRTAISHLKSTGEITCKPTRYGLHICAVKYAYFQEKIVESNTQTTYKATPQITRKSQGSNKEVTTYKEDKEIKEEKEINKCSREFIPPTPTQVKEYADSIGFNIDPEYFCDYYTERGWTLKDGSPMKDWKIRVRAWQRKEKPKHEINDGNSAKPKPDYGFARTADWIEDALAKGD